MNCVRNFAKVHNGEKAVARQIKESSTHSKSGAPFQIKYNLLRCLLITQVTYHPIIADYIKTIHCEVIQLRKDFGTLKKAKCHAKEFLPKEPVSLAEKYTKGTERKTKAEVIATKYSRFTKPAYPVDKELLLCDCSGKCATVRYPCNEMHVVKQIFAQTNKRY